MRREALIVGGVVRRFVGEHAEGSVRVPLGLLAEGSDPARLQPDVLLYAGDRTIGRTKAGFQRLTEGGNPVAVYTFRMALPRAGKARPRRGNTGKLNATALVNGTAAPLTVPGSVALDFSLSMMSAAERMVFFMGSAVARGGARPVMGLCERGGARELNQRKTLCIIIHAARNDPGFRASYEHFCRIVSPLEIYIATPCRGDFAAFAQSSVLTLPDLSEDGAGWASLLSHLATGLQAYYEWSLLVEAGEMVIADPRSGRGFLEQLGHVGQDIVRPIGVDLAQGGGQRLVGRLSSALCKPSLARVHVDYSADLGSCHAKAPLALDDSGFISFTQGGAAHEPDVVQEADVVALSSPRVAAFVAGFNECLEPDEARQLWLPRAPQTAAPCVDIALPTDAPV